jgi:glycosyltransferase involved in cell wall biosynthesis
MSKISVIIPTLNEEKLLGGLLEQFAQKQLREKFDYEIVISDGGSRDATLQIAEKFADKIVLWEKERRQLIAEGRNLGARAAGGDVFLFLNADVRAGNVEKLFGKILDFCSSNFIAMTCPVKVFPEEEIAADRFFTGFYNSYFGFLNLIGLGMGRGECQVVRRKDFFELGGYNETLAAGEDFDLFKRLRKKGKILYAKDCFVYESPRRYRKYGHWKIFFTWLANALSVIFANKSASKEWEEVR